LLTAAGRLPSARDLRIHINANAMQPLVLLLRSNTTLILDVQHENLHHLLHLSVWFPTASAIFPQDLRALPRLVRLRGLEIIGGAAVGVSDKPLDDLLRPVDRLSLLAPKALLSVSVAGSTYITYGKKIFAKKIVTEKEVHLYTLHSSSKCIQVSSTAGTYGGHAFRRGQLYLGTSTWMLRT
jgi:hypothetical protein